MSAALPVERQDHAPVAVGMTEREALPFYLPVDVRREASRAVINRLRLADAARRSGDKAAARRHLGLAHFYNIRANEARALESTNG